MNYQAMAEMLLGYMEVRFKKKFGEEHGDIETNVWAEQLSKFAPDKMGEKQFKNALDYYASIHSTGYPPSVDQFCDALKKATYNEPEVQRLNHHEGDKDYTTLWQMANDKEKMFFFCTHNYQHVPSFILKWFADYNEANRGWTREESWKMIKWHAKPFADANEGAMVSKHRGILDYFKHRKSA